jgi:hypothetical protein
MAGIEPARDFRPSGWSLSLEEYLSTFFCIERVAEALRSHPHASEGMPVSISVYLLISLKMLSRILGFCQEEPKAIWRRAMR